MKLKIEKSRKKMQELMLAKLHNAFTLFILLLINNLLGIFS
jgi:hypothetical protein